MTLAVIGTAGRDKSKKMTRDLWIWMLANAQERTEGEHLVSGGAAWSDHLAVAMYLTGVVDRLTLHLPAPFSGAAFVGPKNSSAAAANYYHSRFSYVRGTNSMAEIQAAIKKGCEVTFESSMPGYSGMFARNDRVAQADRMLAYTFGEKEPIDGGTRYTWDKCQGSKTHVSLPVF